MLEGILNNTVSAKPLVHCITNYVTVNDCANMLLACGGSPIMADDAQEVEAITGISAALVLNIGTLNTRTVDAMRLAGARANALGHPVVFDPVGAGASLLRTNTALSLLEEVTFTVIRGNSSEIKTLAELGGTTKGVDASAADQITRETLAPAVAYAKALAAKTDAVIAITGAIDIVASSSKAYVIENGHPALSRITGAGCMLTAVVGAYVAANPQAPLEATAAAVCAVGFCGELAHAKTAALQGGTATFRTQLIDAMSLLTDEALATGARIAMY